MFLRGDMMNRGQFYTSLRKRGSGVFGTSLSQKQVEGIEAVLDEAEKRKTPLKWLAYMLATDYHETARTMQPIEEYGQGKGKKYGRPGKYGQSQHGRGLVQLTWDFNYEKADAKLGLKGALLQNFNLALRMDFAVRIMFDGMEEGWFTGKKLSDFSSYTPMRKIINGMDKADLIAGYARAFETALVAGGYGVSINPPKIDTSPSSVDPIDIEQNETVTRENASPLPVKKQGWLAALFAAIFRRKS